MAIGRAVGLLVLATTFGAPATARAWGVPGCTNLPEYNRALGALQGMTSACDMSVEEARRVVAAHDGVPAGAAAPGAGSGAGVAPGPAAAPAPRVRHRPRRTRAHNHRSAEPRRR